MRHTVLVMVPNDLISGIQNDGVRVLRGVPLVRTLKHAEVVITIPEGDHVLDVQLSSEMVDGVALTAHAVVNIDPVQGSVA